MNESAKMKMESAIWKHGRKKSHLTVIINKLKQTDLKDHPDIKKALIVLEAERKRLKNLDLF